VNRLIRRIVLLVLLAWLPLQAGAMPWLAFECEQHASGMHDHAAAGQHAQQPGDADSLGAGPSDDGSAAAAPDGSCHHFLALGLPVAALRLAGLTSWIDPTPSKQFQSFSPDLPKRPPLAALV